MVKRVERAEARTADSRNDAFMATLAIACVEAINDDQGVPSEQAGALNDLERMLGKDVDALGGELVIPERSPAMQELARYSNGLMVLHVVQRLLNHTLPIAMRATGKGKALIVDPDEGTFTVNAGDVTIADGGRIADDTDKVGIIGTTVQAGVDSVLPPWLNAATQAVTGKTAGQYLGELGQEVLSPMTDAKTGATVSGQ